VDFGFLAEDSNKGSKELIQLEEGILNNPESRRAQQGGGSVVAIFLTSSVPLVTMIAIFHVG
jgi:hypothetical protein